MGEWRLLHIGFEGDDVLIEGHNVWQHKWDPTGEEDLIVRHPAYPEQRHSMGIYTLAVRSKPRFAAGEFSNGVWGVYVETNGNRVTVAI